MEHQGNDKFTQPNDDPIFGGIKDSDLEGRF